MRGDFRSIQGVSDRAQDFSDVICVPSTGGPFSTEFAIANKSTA